jgi:microcystin-dependent protein
MSCGCNNNYGGGWGGCGCANTVQYAPPACNPNFPTSCTALGTGTIQRVVGEDSASCKYTVPTLSSNSILFYNASTAIVSWGDASVANPVFLGNGSGQATASSGKLQATTPTGQLVAFTPSSSSETQFPVISPGGTNASWGTIESIVPNQGLVYRNNTGTVAQLSAAQGNIVTFDANRNPIAASASTIAGITAVPSGAVLPFAYNVTSGNLPDGWLLCDGSIYTVSSYPTLGALLANTYGGSSGTFAVPNLSGLFIRGSGTQTSGGITYNSGSIGTVQADAFQGHKHSIASNNSISLGLGGQLAAGAGSQSAGSTITIGTPTADGTNGAPRTGSETRPVSLAMVYCIKI